MELSTHLAVQKLRLDLLTGILRLAHHLSNKPAAHESPQSIFVPRNECQYTYPDQTVQTAQERFDAARVAAMNMYEWSKDREDSLANIRGILQSKQISIEKLLEFHLADRLPGDEISEAMSEDLPGADDWSTTQSTMSIMTPTEEWSDLVSSGITERGRTLAITRHSLQLCGYHTESFLKLLDEVGSPHHSGWNYSVLVDGESVQRLHKAYGELVVHLLHALDAPVPSQDRLLGSTFAKTSITWSSLQACIHETKTILHKNTDIEKSFGQLPGSTTADIVDIEAMHKAYDSLVFKLLQNLGAPTPFQDDRFAPAPNPAPEVISPAALEIQNNDVDPDKPLETIIDSMEPTPTDKDSMKLVFHWTTLDECNNLKRADVMELDEAFGDQ